MKQKPEMFTDEKIKYWKNGALDKLKEYENNPENYYWPTEKTS